MAQSVHHRNVRVMVLCPGFVRTEFHHRVGSNMSTIPEWHCLRAEDVVEDALRDLIRGTVISVPDWRYKVLVFGLRHAPRGLLHRVARRAREQIGR